MTDDTSDVTTPRIRRTAGAYELTRVLGSGGFGVVYEAKHRETGRSYAVKRLTMSRQDAERWQKEALYPAQAAAQSLHVLDVRDFFEDELGVYLVMDLLPHGDLRRFIDKSPGPLPIRDALEIALGIARGLAAIHAAGIIHRDLKPSNVIMARLDERWIPKIADFGLARSAESLSLGDFASPNYAAPEQLDLAGTHAVGEAADLFALGMILYELVTGANPSGHTDLREYARWIASHVSPRHPGTTQVGAGPVERPRVRRPELEQWPDVDAVTMDLLQADPLRRPRARAVVATLERAIGTVPIERIARDTPFTAPPSSPASNQSARVVGSTEKQSASVALQWAVAFALILLSSLGGYVWRRSSAPVAVAPSVEKGPILPPSNGQSPPILSRGAAPPSSKEPPSVPAKPTGVVTRSELESIRESLQTEAPPVVTNRESPDVDRRTPEAIPPPPQPAQRPLELAEARTPQPARAAGVAESALKAAASPVNDDAVKTFVGTWVGALRLESNGRPQKTVLNLLPVGNASGTATYGAANQCIAMLDWRQADSARAQLTERRFQGTCNPGRLALVRAGESAVDVVWTYANGRPGSAGRLMTANAYEAKSRDIASLFERWRQIRQEPGRLNELTTVFPAADLLTYQKSDEDVDRHEILLNCEPVAFVGSDSGTTACAWSQTTYAKRRVVSTNGRNVTLFGKPPAPRHTTESFLVALGQRSGSWVIEKLTKSGR